MLDSIDGAADIKVYKIASMTRHSTKRPDDNHDAIRKLFRSLGATWQDTHQITGALDGILGYCGIDQRCEIKDPVKSLSAQKLTDKELITMKTWAGRKPVIIKTEEDCFALLDKMREDARLLRIK